jgi:cytochrome c oxidase cbb3-type subunit III
VRVSLWLAAALLALPAVAADIERGRAVWNFRCYFCHGYSGDAKTLATTFVEPKPRDFQAADPREFPPERIERAVRDGVPNTSMKGFKGILTEAQIRDVSAFLRDEFLVRRAKNTSYHTVENGWPNHERYAAAFPFARGEIALDRPEPELTEEQRRGRRLFVGTCITCHDRAKVDNPGATWERVAPR